MTETPIIEATAVALPEKPPTPKPPIVRPGDLMACCQENLLLNKENNRLLKRLLGETDEDSETIE